MTTYRSSDVGVFSCWIVECPVCASEHLYPEGSILQDDRVSCERCGSEYPILEYSEFYCEIKIYMKEGSIKFKEI